MSRSGQPGGGRGSSGGGKSSGGGGRGRGGQGGSGRGGSNSRGSSGGGSGGRDNESRSGSGRPGGRGGGTGPGSGKKGSSSGSKGGSSRRDGGGGFQRSSGPGSEGARGARGGGARRDAGGGERRKTKKKGLGGDQVEGRQAVRELLLAGNRRIHEILMIEDMDSADVLDDISELAFEMKVPFRPINRKRMSQEALTDSHQGVIARAQPVPETDLDDLAKKKNAFLLVLDGITDPGNLGAILRTAECAGVTGVVLPRHRSVHLSPTVTKTAAGAVEHLPMALVGGIPAALTRLQELGIYTIGLDAGGESSIFQLPIRDSRPIALVLGAEGSGLSRLVSERVDTVAAIPLAGRLNSLNVAMAGAVACFEVVRMRTTQVDDAT